MDKRQFPRQSISISAQFSAAEGNRHACKIMDFSLGGLLIKLNAPLGLVLPSGMPARVEFSYQDQQGCLLGTVAHISSNGIGLRFTPQQQTALALLEQAALEEQANRQSTTQIQPELSRRQQASLIKAASKILQSFMTARLLEYFHQLEDALLSTADEQKSYTEQRSFLDAVSLFRHQQSRLTDETISSLLVDVQELPSGKAAAEADSGDHNDSTLSLVDKEEFEDWLMVRVATSKAEIQWRDPLLELQLRLAAGFGGSQASDRYNPFSPAAICQAYASTLAPLQLGNDRYRLVINIFHDRILAKLGLLYTELNNLFIEQGVLPQIDIGKHLLQAAERNGASGKPAAPQPTATPTPMPDNPSGPIPGPVISSGRTYQTASRLWAAQQPLLGMQHGEYYVPVDSGNPQLAVDLVHTALQQVQGNLLRGHANLDHPGALKNLLIQASGSAAAVSRYQQESAELIEGLFDNIAHPDRVAGDLGSELRKLEVPVLRLMLKDPTLFSAEHHPARQAVNQLAQLADRNSINAATNKPAVLKAINTILQNEEDESAGFKQVLSSLDELVAREKQFFERNLKRLVESCEGKQRITRANRLIERELQTRLSGQLVAQPIIDLLDNGWKELMRVSYLREGSASITWEVTLVVFEQLLIRTLEGAYNEDKLRFSAAKLLRLISQGLGKVPDANSNHRRILGELRSLLSDPTTAGFSLCAYQSAEPDHPGDVTTDLDRSTQRWIRRARQLKAGQWLEQHIEGALRKRYCLAWVAEDHSLYVFSNQRGMRAFELSPVQIAEHLRSGYLTLLDEASMPPLEQGLDALVHKVYDKLTHFSTQDPLTGLINRREFLRQLSQTLDTTDRPECLSLIFIDILQFKLINDSCGYAVGDRFLRDLAATLRRLFGEQSTIGRVGVDQFAILLPLPAIPQGMEAARQLKSTIEAERFTHQEHSFVIASAVALADLSEGSSEPMELLRMVESAAELCKQGGHRDVQMVEAGDQRVEEHKQTIAMVAHINQALDENLLRVRCQKIAPATQGSPLSSHYEALLTVLDQQGQPLSLVDFIRAAETYNRMDAIDRWMIDSILNWMATHPQHVQHIGGFSINLSGCSLNNESFPDFIVEALERYPVPREKLIFEITETAAVDNLENAADFISRIKELGCRFSLDDFGAGQSSYSYLKRLPVDFIKIDGAFVKNITRNGFDFALVKSITEMGHFLNKKIIAEFVTSAEVLDIVTEIGVDYVQGYHIAEPIMLEQLELQDEHCTVLLP